LTEELAEEKDPERIGKIKYLIQRYVSENNFEMRVVCIRGVNSNNGFILFEQ
jgi:hypothetical protein